MDTIKIKNGNFEADKIPEFIRQNKYGDITRLLDGLGRLNNKFDSTPLLFLLKHENEKIRCLAVKNLAKIGNSNLTKTFINIVENDSSSIVRREAVSAIGRLRDHSNKQILFKYLDDSDPEVALQSVRGLLVFKEDEDVQEKLKQLENHPNETIQEIIKKEFRTNFTNGYDPNHTKSPDFMKNVVINGDVREILKLVSDESVHLTFTSPPYYNARDYSIYSSYKEYLDFLEDVFKEVHRITKEGRFFILNTSPIIIPRVGRQYSSKRYPIPYDIHPLIVKMGWEFIDDIVWEKPEASAKNRNAGFLQHRKPLGYKPNPCTECVMVYRKKTDKLIDWNIRQYDQKVVEESKITGDFESSNVWKIDPTFDKIHSAVFPLELCNRVIRFYSFKGDLVFDPFAGSGTLGKSAMNLDRFFFLTEKEKKYISRIKENLTQTRIFSDEKFKPNFLSTDKFKEASK
ncbi:MAG: restriction endonuclease subunit M [Candidatus Altiarchaeales archaeon HGW-Altiarchaeales-1]|nr:MAG: restriction endonuclease subunit M [Candidatus Altiarchaeales archaeon HGW-Altiarchaeales-1]